MFFNHKIIKNAINIAIYICKSIVNLKKKIKNSNIKKNNKLIKYNNNIYYDHSNVYKIVLYYPINLIYTIINHTVKIVVNNTFLFIKHNSVNTLQLVVYSYPKYSLPNLILQAIINNII